VLYPNIFVYSNFLLVYISSCFVTAVHSKRMIILNNANLGKLKKRLRILAKISDVEHCLWIWKIRIVYRQSSIDAIGRTEIGNSTRN